MFHSLQNCAIIPKKLETDEVKKIMKVCPQCNAHYEDPMFFCLEDGQPLKSTDNSIQSNPATFEQTLALPTEEKTLTLPTQNELSGEKTLTLPSDAATEQKSVGTEAWQPVTTPPQPLPPLKTNENVVLTDSIDSNENRGKGKFIIGATLGGLALLGTALGGWWFLRNPSDEVVVVANVNKQTENSNNNLGLSNANLSVNFAENNSNSSNTNSNIFVNTNKSTPKTSPTKDKSPTPTPRETPDETPTLTPTPTPKTPTPTPTAQPTSTPTANPPEVIDGGVLNGKAILLHQPRYPAAAKAAGVGGRVSVRVLIDENGRVVRANAVNGHPLLKETSEQAARSAKFSPMTSGGQRVKVTGVIVFNFVP